MSDEPKSIGGPTAWKSEEMRKRIRARYKAERRFRRLGMAALGIAGGFLLILLFTIARSSIDGFFQSEIRLDIRFEESAIGDISGLEGEDRRAALLRGDYMRLYREALMREFPNVSGRSDIRDLQGMISGGARETLRNMVAEDPSIIGTEQPVWLLVSDDIDMYIKGNVSAGTVEADRRVSNQEITWIKTLQADGQTRTGFSWNFLQNGDSREPEQAGVWGAIVGSFLTLIITLLVAFPIGVFAAIYLEEFAPENKFTDLIEVNINNLAAVPSIIFGLLGLAVFLNLAGLPRSAPLVGGLTLALMTLPTIIIAARVSIKAVPPSIRDAATGLGASKAQVTFHHVLPLSLPGIMTGTIIGMARALGETAPLLMIGMVAFIVDIPGSFTDAATVMPVQIFIWADSPERAFVAKTSAAIIVLLVFLIAMNATAVWLRNKFEKRW